VRLRLHPQGVCHAGVVVEEADDLHRIQDVLITEALSAQRVEILGPDPGGVAGDHHGEIEEGPGCLTDGSGAIVLLDRLSELLITADRTQILCVRLRSVVAPQRAGDHRGYRLSLRATEARARVH